LARSQENTKGNETAQSNTPSNWHYGHFSAFDVHNWPTSKFTLI